MGCNVIFNGCQPAGKSHSLKPFQANRGVGDSFPGSSKMAVQPVRIVWGALRPSSAWGLKTKPFLLEPLQFGAGYACTALQLCQIDLFQREKIPLLGLHFLNGLWYNILQAITFDFFHIAPFTGLLALFSIKDLKEKVMAFSIWLRLAISSRLKMAILARR